MRHNYKSPIYYVRPDANLVRRIIGEVHYRGMTFLVSDDDVLVGCEVLNDQVRAGKADLVRYEATALRLLEVA